jgi:hypothetical protein
MPTFSQIALEEESMKGSNHCTKRLCSCWAILLALLLTITAFGVACSPTQRTDLKEARWQAAQRARRIIYNDDGSYHRPYGTPEQFLSLHLKHLANTQMDTVFHCTGNTTIFRGHVTKVGEMHGQFVPLDNDWDRLQYRSILALREAGHDQLSLVAGFCRARNLEIFFSMRMNDLHDTMWPSRRSRWKRDHLEYCLGREEDGSKYPNSDPRHWWTALNYEQPEVRDYVFRILQDVCQRYDLDGIELDWMRMPMLFRPSLELNPVEPEQVDMINDLMRRIRVMTDEVGQERERPLLVSTRVPLSVARSLGMGLDVRTWLEEALVDMLVLGGGYAPMAMAPQVREMVKLGHRHGIQVYPCISKSGMKGEYDCVEAWRGAAMNIWQTGADGVYTFNLFPKEPDQRFSEMGSPETLKGLDKIYAVDNFMADSFLGCYRPGLFTPGRLPVTLKTGQVVSVKLPVGEDITANAPSGKTAHARLRLRFSRPLEDDELKVVLNGELLAIAQATGPPTSKPEPTLEFEPEPRLFRVGDNQVEVRQVTDKPLVLDRLDVLVTYRPNTPKGTLDRGEPL